MAIHLQNIRGDIYGGVTAAVVALPLAMAFGVASGLGPIAGLYGAIAVGFFAAIFGGTDSQVSGPTGPMTVVMGAVVTQYSGNLADAFTIVFLGGLIQIAFGMLKLGRYIAYTPYSVVSGFMSGIGVIIILIQTLPFVGATTVAGGPIGAIDAWLSGNVLINSDALIIATVGLAIGIFWPKRLSAVLPSALAALIVGTLLSMLLFTQAPVIGEVPTGLPQLIIPTLFDSHIFTLFKAALILALLGSIDSLLTSLVADAITRTQHKPNKELIGQGLGNMFSSLIGGLPGAGATMRTVVNVRAGGRTPISGALHAVILLTLVLGLGPIAEKIPHAILAAILLKVGWDIIDWEYLRRIKTAPRAKMVVMLVTLSLTVFADLVTAVAVGLVMAGFITAEWTEQEEVKGVSFHQQCDDVQLITMNGSYSYASARQLVHHIADLGAHLHPQTLIYDLSKITHLDTSAALALEELFEIAKEEGHKVLTVSPHGHAYNTLSRLRSLDKIPLDQQFMDLKQAIEAAECRLDT